jgi:hypothetical protein
VVNKPFKDHLKQQYGEWFFGEDYALTPDGRIRMLSVTLLRQSIIMAWQRISPDMIVKGFKSAVYPMKWM